MIDSSESMDILGQLEDGQIDAEEAMSKLSGVEGSSHPDGERQAAPPRQWRSWWLIPTSIGIAMAIAGSAIGSLGGWWWLCAGPILLIGVPLLFLGLGTIRSHWVHVRVNTGQDEWPRRISISLPIPLGLTAWGMRLFGPRIKGFDETMIDELFVALDENLTEDTPLYVEIDESETGERVEVYLG